MHFLPSSHSSYHSSIWNNIITDCFYTTSAILLPIWYHFTLSCKYSRRYYKRVTLGLHWKSASNMLTGIGLLRCVLFIPTTISVGTLDRGDPTHVRGLDRAIAYKFFETVIHLVRTVVLQHAIRPHHQIDYGNSGVRRGSSVLWGLLEYWRPCDGFSCSIASNSTYFLFILFSG